MIDAQLLCADGTIVGHVPREVSRVLWHNLGHYVFSFALLPAANVQNKNATPSMQMRLINNI